MYFTSYLRVGMWAKIEDTITVNPNISDLIITAIIVTQRSRYLS